MKVSLIYGKDLIVEPETEFEKDWLLQHVEEIKKL